jgi:hypothetical protein
MRLVAFATVAFAALSAVACSSPDSKYDPNALPGKGGGPSTGGPTSTDPGIATQSGVITDFNTGKPVVGATVKANDSTATTDASGKYTLPVHKGEVFSMEVTAPNYVKLIEQQTALTADYDRGETTIVPMSLSDLLHAALPGYDATLGVLSVAVIPTGTCKSENGTTISVKGMDGAQIKYMVSKLPSPSAQAVKGGEFPSAVIYNLPVNTPVIVQLKSDSCAMAAFPFQKDGITFEASVTTMPGDVTSFQRLFLKGNAE